MCTRLVTRRSNHAARTESADKHWTITTGRIIELLGAREEGIEINMNDGTLAAHAQSDYAARSARQDRTARFTAAGRTAAKIAATQHKVGDLFGARWRR